MFEERGDVEVILGFDALEERLYLGARQIQEGCHAENPVFGGYGLAYAIFGPLFPPSVLGKAFGAYNTICFTGAVAAPVVTGWLRDITGSFVAGSYGAAVLSLLSVVSVMALRPAFRLAGAPPPVAAPTRP